MRPDSRIYLPEHAGLVGSALLRGLECQGFQNIIKKRTSSELDLCDQAATRAFLEAERPEHVLLATAKVGGIHANTICPAVSSRREDLLIQTNIIHDAWRHASTLPGLELHLTQASSLAHQVE